MTADPTDWTLRVWLVPELAVPAGALVVLAASLLGETTLLSSVSRPVRVGALAFAAVELLIPAWVYLDLRRRDDLEAVWLHAAAMPVVNVLGLVAYLAARRSSRE